MKKTKLLAATAMLLLTSCSPKVVTHIVRTYPNPVPADSVYVIEPGRYSSKHSRNARKCFCCRPGYIQKLSL
ncbi:lipoprotein [Bacteroides thetaiotaomicron]|nr:lipoprotein [Bacteroides thetaiotaomicron]